MSGHHHTSDPNLTQNQGNMLGDRPCVRQSRLYREGCSGNVMKELLGQSELTWKTDQTEGCYGGGHVYDHNTEDHCAAPTQQQQLKQQCQPPQQQQQQQQAVSASTGRGLRPGAGYANRQTYNIFTGQ
ncbi:hypothetical protein LPMP_100675 [Leishmania panamensis]|uniref:Uncharacterized protein n=2 Tax=Leishmania guyanensis species complex TaxID=38579 RepID=A0A088RJL1_LEIPA|nr:hypothetical protein LPMP_100675 [Leishmania panamensis]AIN96137.1 hypothetical protein LPMP_100675 [Leishmania panamensis]